MSSFAFLPRKIQARKTKENRKVESKRQEPFPLDVILEVKATYEDSDATNTKQIQLMITSACEILVPRSCCYVYVAYEEGNKVSAAFSNDRIYFPMVPQKPSLPVQFRAYVRASSPATAKQLMRRLSSSDNVHFSCSCEDVRLLQGKEEEESWSTIPLRVKNKAAKHAAALQLKRRRGAGRRKRKKGKTDNTPNEAE
jgi:hypothetical protein